MRSNAASRAHTHAVAGGADESTAHATCATRIPPRSEMFGMWFVLVMALGGVANHVLNPSAGRGMGYLAIAVQFG